MICQKCNTQIDDNIVVCPVCGAYIGGAQNTANTGTQGSTAEYAYKVPVDYGTQQYTDAHRKPDNNIPDWAPSPTRILVYGILALAISGIPGIILGSLAQKNAALYIALCRGSVPPMVNTGRILGKVGFIVSIVSVILSAVYIFFYIMFFSSVFNY